MYYAIAGGGDPEAGEVSDPGDYEGGDEDSRGDRDADTGGDADVDPERGVGPGEVIGPAGHRADIDEGPFLPLETDGLHILDAAGRQVILRGLQHHELQDVDYIGREVLPEDYPLIASWGFTVLRMAISWSRIEPERGSYDSAYLDEIITDMDRAHNAGLTVILEWHQDLWARCSQDEDSEMRPNANGAPDWTCPEDFEFSLLGHWDLFDRLWANEDGLMDSFLEAWGVVIDAPGELVRLHFDFATKVMTVEVEADPGLEVPMVLYAPARQFGDKICLDVEGSGDWTFDLRPETERLLLRFDSAARYTIRLMPCAENGP